MPDAVLIAKVPNECHCSTVCKSVVAPLICKAAMLQIIIIILFSCMYVGTSFDGHYFVLITCFERAKGQLGICVEVPHQSALCSGSYQVWNKGDWYL